MITKIWHGENTTKDSLIIAIEQAACLPVSLLGSVSSVQTLFLTDAGKGRNAKDTNVLNKSCWPSCASHGQSPIDDILGKARWASTNDDHLCSLLEWLDNVESPYRSD